MYAYQLDQFGSNNNGYKVVAYIPVSKIILFIENKKNKEVIWKVSKLKSGDLGRKLGLVQIGRFKIDVQKYCAVAQEFDTCKSHLGPLH